MKSKMTLREVRFVVRSTLLEMKLGLSSFRPNAMERPNYLPRISPLQFVPKDDVIHSNRQKSRNSVDSDPLNDLFLYGDDDYPQANCPSCGDLAEFDHGNEFFCGNCNATFHQHLQNEVPEDV